MNIHITKHAVERFGQRWFLLYGEKTPFHPMFHIKSMLKRASIVTDLNSHHIKRMKKNPKTLFYRNGDFSFVVSHNHLMTVEIARKDCQYLNAA